MPEDYCPLVSIIIPTYNRSHLLLKALQSIFKQTYQNFEILVIDDHSSDNTSEVINTIDDSRVHYYRLTKNLGAPAARNVGLQKAKGDLIGFLDSDDQWLPSKLEKQVDLFNKKKHIGLVYTGIKVKTNELERYILPSKRGDMRNDLLVKNYVGTTSSVLIKKELLDQVGGFDLTFTSCQDWDLFIRLSQKAEFDFVKEPLILYVEHDGERISTNSKSILNGHLNIHKKYRKQLRNLPRKELQLHYLSLCKKVLKAGILLIDNRIIEKGRLFLYKFTKMKSSP